ncbi:MAG: hypothetical protein HYS13_05875 [Planctomycetia bacterium]|nr:hypothetical protein [Planctomycetia bacterium]
MAKSVLEAILAGQWNFEPQEASYREFSATDALPGSEQKLQILAERIRRGLPLWHPHDRRDCEGLFAGKPDE